jgi:glutamine---fructose-6-phosphate transaminase (isomerizing)
MCGIFGVSLASQKADVGGKVLAGLQRLEYRGYDSWGIAVLYNAQILIEKHTGKISAVKKTKLPLSTVAIGHTRWATHGGVTDTNAHPHAASDGSFVLAQNGVMENYQEIKVQLQKKGYTFISQTDTEVIVHLIEEVQKNAPSSQLTFSVVMEAFKQLRGRNTIALLTTEGQLFAIRDGSPLVVGRDAAHNLYISSDVLSLAAEATEYVPLESGEGVSIERDQLAGWNVHSGRAQHLHWRKIDLESTVLDKAGYSHFMVKEIMEQGSILIEPLKAPGDQLEKLALAMKKARRVFTVGAGSADFVSGQIAFYLRQHGIHATAVKSYESRSFRGLVKKGDLCLAVSQSGETADTVEVIEWMKSQGAKIASIINMPGSTITRLSDIPCMLQIGPEIGIASTKAVTSMMVWGKVLAELVGGKPLRQLREEVEQCQEQLTRWLQNKHVSKQLKQLAKQFAQKKDVFILGRGQLYMPALESALKLKEISYLHAEGFSGGELKHGVIALIEPGTPVFCLVAEDEEKADMLNAAAEIKARGAHVIGVAASLNPIFDEWISVPANPQFAAISSILPAQLLTYYLALEKGLDPDKPRNLAKSVTVK